MRSSDWVNQSVRSIGVDIGGTKLAIGGLSDHGQLVGYTERPLPSSDYDGLIRSVADSVDSFRDLHGDGSTPTLGLAMAGWLSPDRDVLVRAPNLGWTDRKLRGDLAAATGLRTTVHNDGNAAAWGEYIRLGRPAEGGLVMFTLGTDVGGGVIVNGQLLTGASGVAGELGHLVVLPDGPVCVCGSAGCLAVYASGTAMRDNARGLMQSLPASAPLLRAACQGDPGRLTGHHLAAAIHADEPAALLVLRCAAWALARASSQISRVIDHHTLVLGGGASGIGEKLRAAVEVALRDTAPLGPVLPLPRVRLATAGNEAGVLGAADLSLTPDLTDQTTTPQRRTI